MQWNHLIALDEQERGYLVHMHDQAMRDLRLPADERERHRKRHAQLVEMGKGSGRFDEYGQENAA